MNPVTGEQLDVSLVGIIEADLLPDPATKTLDRPYSSPHQAAHDEVLEKFCAALNETQTVFPGTDLTLIFKIARGEFLIKGGGPSGDPPRRAEALSFCSLFGSSLITPTSR